MENSDLKWAINVLKEAGLCEIKESKTEFNINHRQTSRTYGYMNKRIRFDSSYYSINRTKRCIRMTPIVFSFNDEFYIIKLAEIKKKLVSVGVWASLLTGVISFAQGNVPIGIISIITALGIVLNSIIKLSKREWFVLIRIMDSGNNGICLVDLKKEFFNYFCEDLIEKDYERLINEKFISKRNDIFAIKDQMIIKNKSIL